MPDLTPARPETLLRPAVLAMQAYPVAPADGLIKLDAMENPYDWPPGLREEWLQAVAGVQPNRYPDAAAEALKQRLRETFAIPPELGMVLGNGSDELIQLLALALGGGSGGVLSPGPSFVMYRLLADIAGLPFHEVPLRASDFELDGDAMLAAITEHRPAVVYLAYPNNPTGNLFSRATIEAVLATAPGLVVVDEAYQAFCDDSFLADVRRWPNLLLMRTVSKLGMAGLRFGFLVGATEWTRQLEKCRLPYNINSLTQVSVDLALRRFPVFEAQTRQIREDRSRLFAGLAALPGLRVFPGQANFLTFRVPAGRAGELHAGLLARGVLIKRLDRAHPLLADCLRVTVGTPGENAAFLTALGDLLSD